MPDVMSRFREFVGRVTAPEKQELWCHGCGNYVQFELDMGLDGNHVLECPNCGHEHCRVVRNGRITDIRWGSRNGGTFTVSSNVLSFTTASTFTTSTSSSFYLYQSWSNTGTS